MLETKTFRGFSFSLSPDLTEKVWLFKPNSSSAESYQLFLSPTGRINSHNGTNERFWRIENHQLLILNNNATLSWQSTGIEYQNDGRLIIFLKNSDQTFCATLEEQQTIQNQISTYPEVTSQTSVQEVSDVSIISDSEFIFPSNLELTPSIINRVLIIGSSIAALCHEQLTQEYPDTLFDFISYEYVGPLPTSLPVPLTDYDVIYIQPSLRSIMGDDIVWGERFNSQGFTENLLNNAKTTLQRFSQYIAEYSTLSDTPIFVTNFLTPQQRPVPFSHSKTSTTSVSDIVQNLNTQISNNLDNYPTVCVLDINAVASIIGKRHIQDDHIYFYTHNGIMFQDWDDFGSIARDVPIPNIQTFYPSKRNNFGSLLFRQLIWELRTLTHIDSVKAVIFNTDNILWRGHFSKDYQEKPEHLFPRRDGWPMGIWEAIHYLRGRGIVVCLCANGNEKDIKTAWDKIIQPHFLSLNDFDLIKIGPEPVDQAVVSICNELNIQPAQTVMVEACALRRATLSKACPEIRIIGNNPYAVRRILLWSAETQSHIPLIQNNINTLPLPVGIEKKPTNNQNMSALFQAVQCEVSARHVTIEDKSIIQELPKLASSSVSVNMADFTQIDIKTWLEAPDNILLVFSAKDRFVNYGLSGAFFICRHAIQQFLLSPRVLGLGIENFMISEMIKAIRKQFGDADISITIPNGAKASALRNIYIRAGFRLAHTSQNMETLILSME